MAFLFKWEFLAKIVLSSLPTVSSGGISCMASGGEKNRSLQKPLKSSSEDQHLCSWKIVLSLHAICLDNYLFFNSSSQKIYDLNILAGHNWTACFPGLQLINGIVYTIINALLSLALLSVTKGILSIRLCFLSAGVLWTWIGFGRMEWPATVANRLDQYHEMCTSFFIFSPCGNR
jgi:hypothetical protein